MMSDESLPAVWISDAPVTRERVMTTLNAVLHEDRDARDKERWIRIASVAALTLLCPALLWCAAYGRTPAVRGGYALMAVGTAVFVFADWVLLGWRRQALPGPADARSQLQRTAFLLSRQANVIRTTAVWCAPIFIGTALIALWIYRERSHVEAYLLWTIVGAGWATTASAGISKAAKLDDWRNRMEQLLSDLA
jgi:hypothetical protein